MCGRHRGGRPSKTQGHRGSRGSRCSPHLCVSNQKRAADGEKEDARCAGGTGVGDRRKHRGIEEAEDPGVLRTSVFQTKKEPLTGKKKCAMCGRHRGGRPSKTQGHRGSRGSRCSPDLCVSNQTRAADGEKEDARCAGGTGAGDRRKHRGTEEAEDPGVHRTSVFQTKQGPLTGKRKMRDVRADGGGRPSKTQGHRGSRGSRCSPDLCVSNQKRAADGEKEDARCAGGTGAGDRRKHRGTEEAEDPGVHRTSVFQTKKGPLTGKRKMRDVRAAPGRVTVENTGAPRKQRIPVFTGPLCFKPKKGR